MNNLDIVLIVALIIGFAIGYFKGLISQLSFGVGIVIGLLQAVLFYAPVAQRIQSATGWESIVCTAAAFIGIILAVILLFKIAGWIVSALLKAIHLAFIDRILGAVLSTVIAILLVVGITNAGNAITKAMIAKKIFFIMLICLIGYCSLMHLGDKITKNLSIITQFSG